MGKLWVMVVILFMSGCAGVPCKKCSMIEVGEPEQVQGCQLVKTFSSPAGYRMWGTPYKGNSVDKILVEAEKLGATHYLMRQKSEGLESVTVINAYRCPPGYNAFTGEDEYIEYEK